jgi:hypothetical protein
LQQLHFLSYWSSTFVFFVTITMVEKGLLLLFYSVKNKNKLRFFMFPLTLMFFTVLLFSPFAFSLTEEGLCSFVFLVSFRVTPLVLFLFFLHFTHQNFVLLAFVFIFVLVLKNNITMFHDFPRRLEQC